MKKRLGVKGGRVGYMAPLVSLPGILGMTMLYSILRKNLIIYKGPKHGIAAKWIMNLTVIQGFHLSDAR